MKKFIYSKWLKAPHGSPVEFYSELDEQRYETRKIEIFQDGKIGYATRGKASNGTRLGIEPVPSINEIAAQPEFTVKEITQEDFNRKWKEFTST